MFFSKKLHGRRDTNNNREHTETEHKKCHDQHGQNPNYHYGDGNNELEKQKN